MKKKILVLLLLIAACMCSACKSDKYNIAYEVVYVSKSSKVEAVTFYSLSDYGDINTFNLLDDNRMTEYNYSVDGIAVSRKLSEVVGDRIKLVTTYNNFLAYDGYNGVQFMTGTVEESLLGFDYDAVFKSALTDDEVSAEEVMSHKDLYVVIIQQDMNIILDGQIVYYSDNVKLSNESHAVATDDGLCYIIFK